MANSNALTCSCECCVRPMGNFTILRPMRLLTIQGHHRVYTHEVSCMQSSWMLDCNPSLWGVPSWQGLPCQFAAENCALLLNMTDMGFTLSRVHKLHLNCRFSDCLQKLLFAFVDDLMQRHMCLDLLAEMEVHTDACASLQCPQGCRRCTCKFFMALSNASTCTCLASTRLSECQLSSLPNEPALLLLYGQECWQQRLDRAYN